jgi:ferric-dicitrate binding protein FerR (iron transport regulator)
MDDKSKIIKRYFDNQYSRTDYLEFKRMLFAMDPSIELLLESHWNKFNPDEVGTKDLSPILFELNQRIDSRSNTSVFRKILITYSKIAAIFIIPLLLGLGLLYSRYNQFLSQRNVFVDIISPAGSRTSLNLPDGSLVWLNGDSHIRYPVVFGGVREVQIDGEAFFRVKSDKTHPFLVKAKNVVIKATGTEFNVKAYKDNSKVNVILKEGKVAVWSSQRPINEEMAAGHQLSYDEQSYLAEYSEVNATNYSGWIDGRLIFNHATMAEVAERMKRWYGVDIEVVDKELLKLHFKATFVNENIEEALKLLQATATFDYKFAQGTANEDGSHEKAKIYIIKR